LPNTIFSQGNESWHFTKNAVNETTTPSELAQRMQRVAHGMKIAPRESETSGEVGGTWKWGGKGGPEFNGYLKGKVQDNKGNSAEVKVQQNSDGTGSATASAKHENSNKK
jgi:hypothetical protein